MSARTGFAPLARQLWLAARVAAVLLPAMGSVSAAERWPPVTPVESRGGLVVCASPPAADVGAAILNQGGNAVDAAIATALAMAVTFPEAGNIGGGGFMLIWPGQGREPVCIEYRETAPAACRVDTFVHDASQEGHRVVGVPGTIRGLELAHRHYGSLPWNALVLPAVRLARDGFQVDRVMAADLNRLVADSARNLPEFARVFGSPDGRPWKAGDLLRQPELADTLERIAQLGPDEFYTGRTAELLLDEMTRGRGLMTADDLRAYRAERRRPVHGTYRGYDIYSAPPPSSGGTALVTMLNILEQFPLREYGRHAPETLHLMTEAMRRAYADRARYLGDPAFTEIPAFLTTKEHARKLAATIDPARATPSAEVATDIALAEESPSTTHFSVVDGRGMAVSNTYTLQNSYGSRVVVRGAGFLLNNEMTDFNWRPGVTDRSGRIGTPANQVAPGKRMVSSQTPTIVARDGRLVLVTGSPGGRTIPNTTLGVVLNVLEFGMEVAPAVDAPRTHHQWFPDELQFEGVDWPEHAAAARALEGLGHRMKRPAPRQGDAHSIQVFDGRAVGAADTRRTVGKAAAAE